jgi:glucose-1-phosphate thymidylyltransferase
MACAGAHLVYMVIRRGKWDIPEYYGPGTGTGVDIAYIVTDLPYGAPFSLKQALPFASQSIVLFGFPDIRLKPVNAFLHLLSKMHETRADLVLGLFRATDPSKMDMVRLNRYGDITAIDIKPATSSLTYTWLIAVWSSAFTNFMQSHLDKMEPRLRKQRSTGFIGWEAEYYLGHVILAALKTDIKISHVIFQEGQYIDIGTPEILFETMKYIGSLKGEEDDHC